MLFSALLILMIITIEGLRYHNTPLAPLVLDVPTDETTHRLFERVYNFVYMPCLCIYDARWRQLEHGRFVVDYTQYGSTLTASSGTIQPFTPMGGRPVTLSHGPYTPPPKAGPPPLGNRVFNTTMTEGIDHHDRGHLTTAVSDPPSSGHEARSGHYPVIDLVHSAGSGQRAISGHEHVIVTPIAGSGHHSASSGHDPVIVTPSAGSGHHSARSGHVSESSGHPAGSGHHSASSGHSANSFTPSSSSEPHVKSAARPRMPVERRYPKGPGPTHSEND